MTNNTPRRPIGRRSPGEGRRTFWTLAGVAALLCGLGLAHTWTRIAYLDRHYQLLRARQENQDLEHRIQSLKIELGSLQGASRVDRAAQEQLLMKRPPPDRTVVLEKRPGHSSVAPSGVKNGSLAVNEP